MTQYGKNNRIDILDALRGAAIVYVVVFHLLYDLIYFKGFNIPFFYSKPFGVVHSVFLGVLILVSGICTSFSRNVLRRGAVLALLGALITVGTTFLLPESLIVFGVLSFFGSSMVIYDLSRPAFDKIPWQITLIMSAALFISLRDFGSGVIDLFFTKITFSLPENRDYLYPLGITSPSFSSEDYFPLIPTFFVFLAGTALSKPILSNKLPKKFYTAKTPVINFIGRHSLLIYLVHQPIIFLFLQSGSVIR
jgi:uncharacterized membrane protein